MNKNVMIWIAIVLIVIVGVIVFIKINNPHPQNLGVNAGSQNSVGSTSGGSQNNTATTSNAGSANGNGGSGSASGSTGGNSAPQPTAPVPGSGIQPEFFGMGTVNINDFPPFSIGFLGHPTFVWASVEHSRGVYNWTGIDGYVNAAKAHGLVDKNGAVDISLTLGLTPSWAVANQSSCVKTGARDQCTIPPDNIQDWTDFLKAMMAHYNGVTEPHVKYFELWNEVTAPNFWTGTTAQLVQLAAAAYPIIHTDPYSQLLTPSVTGYVGTNLSNDGGKWMTQYLQAGGAQYADGLAFHGYLYARENPGPYPWPTVSDISTCNSSKNCYNSITQKISTFRGIMDSNGMSGKPIFQTEGSWGIDTVTDPQEQVAWLAQWLILQAGVSAENNLQATSWFTWGGGSAQTGGEQTYGDIENTNGTPTAAGNAYEEVYHWLIGATISPCTQNGSTWSCTLSKPGGYQGEILWSGASSCTTVSCPAVAQSVSSEFKNYINISGVKTAISNGSLSVSAIPVLLQNQ